MFSFASVVRDEVDLVSCLSRGRGIALLEVVHVGIGDSSCRCSMLMLMMEGGEFERTTIVVQVSLY